MYIEIIDRKDEKYYNPTNTLDEQIIEDLERVIDELTRCNTNIQYKFDNHYMSENNYNVLKEKTDNEIKYLQRILFNMGIKE